jgi:hypothetical protein
MSDQRSEFRVWLDTAWTEVIKPMGAIIILVIGYALYHFDLLSERVAGIGLVLAVVVGLVAAGVIPALPLTRRSSQRVMIVVLAALALAGAGWPTLRLAISPTPLATARFSPNMLKTTVQTGADGPYEVIVSGHFKQPSAGDVEASYALKLAGQGEAEISGQIKRSTHRYRTGRRGGTSTSLEERTEAIHRVDGVRGSQITISTDGIDDQLDGNLEVSIRSAGPRSEIFWALAGLAVLLGLILDARLSNEIREEDRKVRGPKREQSYLTVVTAMLLVFAINFPMEATPHALVRAAVGAFFLALLVGGAGGWLVASFVRLATRPKRKS